MQLEFTQSLTSWLEAPSRVSSPLKNQGPCEITTSELNPACELIFELFLRPQFKNLGNSLGVQWLGLSTFTASMGSIPGQGMKITQTTGYSQRNFQMQFQITSFQELWSPDTRVEILLEPNLLPFPKSQSFLHVSGNI